MKKIFILKNYISYAFKTAPLDTVSYLFVQILYLFMPMIQIIVVSSFINNIQNVIQSGNISIKIFYYTLLLIFSFVLSYSLKILSKTILIKLSQKANYSFELSFVTKRNNLSYSILENSDNNDLIERISEKCDNAITHGLNSIMEFLAILIRLISIAILLVKSSIWVSMVVLAALLLLSYVAYQSGEREYDSYKIAAKHNRRARVYLSMINSRACADERSLFNYGQHINESWEKEFDTARKINIKTILINFIRIKGLSVIMAFLAFAIAAILLIPLNNKSLSVGLYISIVTEVFNLIQKLSWDLSDVIQELIVMKNYMIDYYEFLELPELNNERNSINISAENMKEHLKVDSITFKDVSFKYPNTDEYVINNMNFQLKRGNTYAFVGENGAGKSTIIKLLLGIYKDYEGEILINDMELRSITAESWYKFFSVVYQDFARYQISAIDNILIGKIENVRDSVNYETIGIKQVTNKVDNSENVESIIEQVGLKQVFSSLPKGINTMLGQLEDEGNDLSGGEWQKIAIARALFSNNPIQILDEPTSALDPIMEKQIYNLFYDTAKGDIKIMISHRLGGVKNADEIIVLKGGQIHEKGTHEYLINKKGIYENMYEKQRRWYYEEKDELIQSVY